MLRPFVLAAVAVSFALFSWVGCGASAPTPQSAAASQTNANQAAPSAPPAASSAMAPDAKASVATAPGAQASAATDKPKGAASSALDLREVKSASATGEELETFPSGLVVDLRKLGGPAPGPELPKGTRILHVGDSFAGALGLELNKALTAAGVKSRLQFETSTYIPTWAHNGKLGGLMSSFKPDLVLISLGANELENPQPEKRAALIQRIVGVVGETPCVWIAPVLWEGAKATLLEVIRANVGHCVYLDSNELVKKMPRAGDRIHPSMAARPDWAAATVRWLAYHRKPSEHRPWAIAAEL